MHVRLQHYQYFSLLASRCAVDDKLVSLPDEGFSSFLGLHSVSDSDYHAYGHERHRKHASLISYSNSVKGSKV